MVFLCGYLMVRVVLKACFHCHPSKNEADQHNSWLAFFSKPNYSKPGFEHEKHGETNEDVNKNIQTHSLSSAGSPDTVIRCYEFFHSFPMFSMFFQTFSTVQWLDRRMCISVTQTSGCPQHWLWSTHLWSKRLGIQNSCTKASHNIPHVCVRTTTIPLLILHGTLYWKQFIFFGASLLHIATMQCQTCRDKPSCSALNVICRC